MARTGPTDRTLVLSDERLNQLASGETLTLALVSHLLFMTGEEVSMRTIVPIVSLIGVLLSSGTGEAIHFRTHGGHCGIAH